jgi:AcrR family transcriptional regulator
MTPKLNPTPSGEAAQRILAAAVEIVDASGESALRIADVMERAGVQAPMIYRHFGDREGLVQSAQLARGIGVQGAEVVAFAEAATSAGDAASFRAALAGLMRTIGGAEQQSLRRNRLEVIGASVSRPELLERFRGLRRMVMKVTVDALDRAQAEGWIRADLDTRVVAEWGLGSSVGLAVSEQLSDDPDIAGAWLELQIRAMSALLFGDLSALDEAAPA